MGIRDVLFAGSGSSAPSEPRRPGNRSDKNARRPPEPVLQPPVAEVAGETTMEQWKRTFVEKLGKAKGQWVKQFEERMDAFVTPAFEDLSSFVREHGFQVSTPLQDEGRRSFKFELAENAYLLVIFRSTGVGEFELRVECFVPGREPNLHKSIGRLVDVDRAWASRRFESGLDKFVELLGGSNAERAATEEMVAV